MVVAAVSDTHLAHCACLRPAPECVTACVSVAGGGRDQRTWLALFSTTASLDVTTGPVVDLQAAGVQSKAP